ncbi:MAG: endonuclease/exonuclease/phosphatase family protein [Verrucomicrobiales bacterium]|nr:endonuclease/exonuclease/phosphatase family protein [Verrucomicrobiales bacterium]
MSSLSQTQPRDLRFAIVWLLRAGILVMSAAALAVFLVVVVGMEWIGQRNIATAFCMFLPRWIWALPLALMTPLLLLLRWRAGLIALGTVHFYWVPWTGYEWLGSKSDLSAAAEVRVMTWNRGQSGGESLQPFKNRTRPDIIAMQDAARRMAGYQTATEYGELPNAAQSGEFLVLSRFPVRATETLAYATQPGVEGARQTIVGASFEVDGPRGTFALYSVHFPTPRDMLSFYRHGIPIYGLIGIPGTAWGAKRAIYQAYWDGQGNLHRQVAERLKKEKLPMLLLGDFNCPSFGPWYRLFSGSLHDSHSVGGSGYGYTFPGKTGNPLALFRSCLRLDRIFADASWQLVCQETESHRGPQHVAVFAGYTLKKTVTARQ